MFRSDFYLAREVGHRLLEGLVRNLAQKLLPLPVPSVGLVAPSCVPAAGHARGSAAAQLRGAGVAHGGGSPNWRHVGLPRPFGS